MHDIISSWMKILLTFSQSPVLNHSMRYMIVRKQITTCRVNDIESWLHEIHEIHDCFRTVWDTWKQWLMFYNHVSHTVRYIFSYYSHTVRYIQSQENSKWCFFFFLVFFLLLVETIIFFFSIFWNNLNDAFFFPVSERVQMKEKKKKKTPPSFLFFFLSFWSWYRDMKCWTLYQIRRKHQRKFSSWLEDDLVKERVHLFLINPKAKKCRENEITHRYNIMTLSIWCMVLEKWVCEHEISCKCGPT